MAKLLGANAMQVVDDPSSLVSAIDAWLTNPISAAQMGRSAQNVVHENQGATAQHVIASSRQRAADRERRRAVGEADGGGCRALVYVSVSTAVALNRISGAT